MNPHPNAVFMAHDILALCADLSDQGKCCIAARYSWPVALIDAHIDEAIEYAKALSTTISKRAA